MTRWALILTLLLGCHRPAHTSGPARIVSLSPAITETLFAIGAGSRVVGVTDFCQALPDACRLPHAGSILQPNYEAIARLRPTLILGERIRNTPVGRLSAIAQTRALPWLTLSDVVSSTRELGRLSSRQGPADSLARRIQLRLGAAVPANGPRVLLVIASEPGPLSEVWYVKRNSLHGRVLEAAGGRNAVDEDVQGAPVLSLERLMAVNPDVVLLLVSDDHLSPEVRQQYIDAWKALPIRAVMRGAVQVLAGTDVQATGPRILTFADRLAATLREVDDRP